VVKKLALVVALGACGKFQDPDIVVDLRILAMSADLPDQVIDVDPSMPPQASEILAQISPATVCVLMGDPANDRRLRWTMSMCEENSDSRCEDDAQRVIGSGLIEDPDTTTPEPKMCATVQPNGDLFSILALSLADDTFKGLDGIAYQVVLTVGGELDDPADDIYGTKELKVTPRIPANRTGNKNPTIDELDVRPGDADDTPTYPIAYGRCVDQPNPLEVFPETKVRLTPVETPGARETYVVPTLSGGSATFTESLTYSWSAALGSFSSGDTGGTRDITGDPPALFTDWKAPAASDLDGPTDVTLWIVQRDERLGVTWYETCIRVVP
jgi:hypothetical protein